MIQSVTLGNTALRALPKKENITQTSSPFGILRLEMMMILSSLSNVTTSATQLGAQE